MRSVSKGGLAWGLRADSDPPFCLLCFFLPENVTKLVRRGWSLRFVTRSGGLREPGRGKMQPNLHFLLEHFTSPSRQKHSCDAYLPLFLPIPMNRLFSCCISFRRLRRSCSRSRCRFFLLFFSCFRRRRRCCRSRRRSTSVSGEICSGLPFPQYRALAAVQAEIEMGFIVCLFSRPSNFKHAVDAVISRALKFRTADFQCIQCHVEDIVYSCQKRANRMALVTSK